MYQVYVELVFGYFVDVMDVMVVQVVDVIDDVFVVMDVDEGFEYIDDVFFVQDVWIFDFGMIDMVVEFYLVYG